ncbi:hypothetical protein MTO96_045304 [Rhipicephalus appendiculatus]
MPPPKEHFFNVRTPLGTSVDEVIDATETLVGLQEIYSVQHHGGRCNLEGHLKAQCDTRTVPGSKFLATERTPVPNRADVAVEPTPASIAPQESRIVWRRPWM